MKKNLMALAGALALLLTGCNSTSNSTPSSQSSSSMAVPSAPQAEDFGRRDRVQFDHIVIVIEENHEESQVIGDPNMPYINGLANKGALMTNSHGVTHPSEPNYLALISGSTFGYTDDACGNTVTGSCLGTQLLNGI